MGKHKKTLEQKKISDLRRNLYTFNTSQSVLNQTVNRLDSKTSPLPVKSTTSFSINQYPYLISDISKTGILTGIIILAQIILYFLLKNHILVLPMVKY